MKFALVLSALCALYVNVESQLFHDIKVADHVAFESYQEHFKKEYHPKEKSKRFAMFVENRKRVNAMNEKYNLGLVSFESGLNRLSDLSKEEFMARSFSSSRGMAEQLTNLKNAEDIVKHSVHKRAAPLETIDWKDKGKEVVAGAWDQGDCAASYSFAAVDAIVAQGKIANGKLPLLSHQQPIDCSDTVGNSKCESGTAQGVFRYLIKSGKAIASKSGYPYTSTNGKADSCKFKDSMQSVIKVIDFVNVAPGEDNLKAAVSEHGPVAVFVDAAHESFWNYKDGIYDEAECKNDPKEANHWMLVVGYGTNKAGRGYWILKNSFGDNWGNKGFIRFPRNEDNKCCISCFPTYPVIDQKLAKS